MYNFSAIMVTVYKEFSDEIVQKIILRRVVGFGTVVINSKISKTIQLSNFGDVPSKFEWDTKFCGKYFTISPEKGHLNAH